MKRKLVSLLLSLSLMVVSVTGCQSDSVTEETKKEVQTKKSQVLSLYKEIEKYDEVPYQIAQRIIAQANNNR